MKRMVAGVMAAVLMLSLCACGKDDTSLSDLSDKGAVVVGFELEHAPFAYRMENGAYKGFDLDVAVAVASKLGVTLNIRGVENANGEALLDESNVDFLCNNQEELAGKSRALAESEALFTNRVILAVRPGTGYDSLSQLEGKKVAVVAGTLCEEAVQGKREFASKITVVNFGSEEEALAALEDQLVDAMAADEMFIRAKVKDGATVLMMEEALLEQDYCMLFRKEDKALRERVNGILKELAADGTLQELSIRWFGADVITLK